MGMTMQAEEIHELLRFMKFCPQSGPGFDTFQETLLAKMSDVTISDAVHAYLDGDGWSAGGSFDPDGYHDLVSPESAPARSASFFRSDPRHDFGISFRPTRCNSCQKLSLNRGCVHCNAIYCLDCYTRHLPCPRA